MEWIKRAWRGEEKLWKVFWLYGMVGQWIVPLALLLIAAVLLIFNLVLLSVALLPVGFTIYLLWLFVSQWRCAFNTEWKLWGYIARAFVIIALISLSWVLTKQGIAYQDGKTQCRAIMAQSAALAGVAQETYSLAHENEYDKCMHEKTEAIFKSLKGNGE